MTQTDHNPNHEIEQQEIQDNNKGNDQNLWINWTIITEIKRNMKSKDSVIKEISIHLSRYLAKNGVKSNQRFKFTIFEHSAISSIIKITGEAVATGSPIKSPPPPPPPIIEGSIFIDNGSFKHLRSITMNNTGQIQ